MSNRKTGRGKIKHHFAKREPMFACLPGSEKSGLDKHFTCDVTTVVKIEDNPVVARSHRRMRRSKDIVSTPVQFVHLGITRTVYFIGSEQHNMRKILDYNAWMLEGRTDLGMLVSSPIRLRNYFRSAKSKVVAWWFPRDDVIIALSESDANLVVDDLMAQS